MLVQLQYRAQGAVDLGHHTLRQSARRRRQLVETQGANLCAVEHPFISERSRSWGKDHKIAITDDGEPFPQYGRDDHNYRTGVIDGVAADHHYRDLLAGDGSYEYVTAPRSIHPRALILG